MSIANSLLDKIKKTSNSEYSSVLDKSVMFNEKEMVATEIPMLNVALSGDIDGGLSSGLLVIGGPSRHFKSMYSLIIASAYLKKHPEAILLFYDSEFGAPVGYFEQCGIDTSRVFHTPIVNIEELKLDLVQQLESLDRKDKVIILIDSIGNTSSKKELSDSLTGKAVADMGTRARELKSLFRMITPYLTTKDFPLIAVNHTYKTLELFSKEVMSGGTGIQYSSNAVWFIGRRQDKDGKEIAGYDFIIKIDKSRFVYEKSVIPISVKKNGGIQKWSGLLELAIESGHVIKTSPGKYQHVDKETKDPISEILKEKDTYDEKFWKPILEETDFKTWIKQKFKLGHLQTTFL